MTQAICTPTKTRAEFESILRELDWVGVKWESGCEPMTHVDLYSIRFGHMFYMIAGDPTLTYGDGQCFPDVPVLPRADFISAIKRDFGKEKPKVNYNKMLKKDLIDTIKIIRADNAEIKAKWIEQDEELNRLYLENVKLKGINSELLEDTKKLEKTNAEQAGEVDSLKTGYNASHKVIKTLEDNLAGERRALKKITAKLEKQTVSISKFFADVLEGK